MAKKATAETQEGEVASNEEIPTGSPSEQEIVLQEETPKPRLPKPHDTVVFCSTFGGHPCTAFINKVLMDGRVNLVALVPGESNPAVHHSFIPYSKVKTAGTWHWIED